MKTKTTYLDDSSNCPSITVTPKDGELGIEINTGFNTYTVAEVDAFVELWQTVKAKIAPPSPVPPMPYPDDPEWEEAVTEKEAKIFGPPLNTTD